MRQGVGVTTIAWDGKTLAVDSRSTSNGVVISDKETKLYINVGVYQAVAITGSMTEMPAFVDWLRHGEQGDRPKSEGCALCIAANGKAYTFHTEKIGGPVEEFPPSANGSGWEIALGAMDAGATAVEAVKIACKRDVYSGVKVRSFTVDKLPLQGSRKGFGDHI
jgi:20S proteasome alpha/beta subunit